MKISTLDNRSVRCAIKISFSHNKVYMSLSLLVCVIHWSSYW